MCEQQRLFTKPKINHLLHAILTVITLGVWAVVWVTLAIINSGKKQRCATCGWFKGVGKPTNAHTNAHPA